MDSSCVNALTTGDFQNVCFLNSFLKMWPTGSLYSINEARWWKWPEKHRFWNALMPSIWVTFTPINRKARRNNCTGFRTVDILRSIYSEIEGIMKYNSCGVLFSVYALTDTWKACGLLGWPRMPQILSVAKSTLAWSARIVSYQYYIRKRRIQGDTNDGQDPFSAVIPTISWLHDITPRC
jgi:hypothetical protein